MLGNRSNECSEVLPRRGSLTRSCVCVRLGFRVKTTATTKKPTAGKCLLTAGTLAVNS